MWKHLPILLLPRVFFSSFKLFLVADSPKRQNKGNNSSNSKNVRNVSTAKRTILSKSKAKSMAHDIVVVREANKKIEIDPDIQRLQVNKTDWENDKKMNALRSSCWLSPITYRKLSMAIFLSNEYSNANIKFAISRTRNGCTFISSWEKKKTELVSDQFTFQSISSSHTNT